MKTSQRFFIFLLSPFLLLSAHAGTGKVELRQSMMPISITEPGTYQLVENLSLGSILVAKGSVWRYLDDGSNQGTNWVSQGFNDNSWSSGAGSLGFGNPGITTTVDDNNQVTTYFRTTFNIDDPSQFGDAQLLAARDDGIVAYINGTEVARDNLPGGSITFVTTAITNTSNSKNNVDEKRYRSFDVDHTLFVAGTNTLAVELHNFSASNADIEFDAILTAAEPGMDGNGIEVLTSGVQIDLNGFALRGVPGETGDGIFIDSLARNTEVFNGTITGWGDNGIDAGSIGTVPTREATGSVFRLLRISDCFHDGIQAGPNTLVEKVTSASNGRLNADFNYEIGVGIKVYRGSLVTECIVHNNHSHGIVPRSRSEVHNCIVYHNGHDGVHAGQENLIRGTIVSDGEVNADGIEVNGDSLVTHCVSYENSDDGMKSRNLDNTFYYRCVATQNGTDGLHPDNDGNLVIECTTVGNADDGIVVDVGGSSLVARNNSHQNGFGAGGTPGGGVRVDQPGNWVHGNHVMGNERGIETANSGVSLITGNSAGGNDIDYQIITTSSFATPSSNPSTADAWDNFDL